MTFFAINTEKAEAGRMIDNCLTVYRMVFPLNR